MLFYQIMIPLTIILASIIFGKKGTNIVSALWVVETITVIFTPWLLLVQIINIGVSFVIGSIISHPSNFLFKSFIIKMKDLLGDEYFKFILFAIVILIIMLFLKIYMSQQPYYYY